MSAVRRLDCSHEFFVGSGAEILVHPANQHLSFLLKI